MTIHKPTTATLPPIYPNEGLIIAYQRKLVAMVRQLEKSLNGPLLDEYKANPPDMALDSSLVKMMQQLIKRQRRKWNKDYTQTAIDIAKHYTMAVLDRVDGALEAAADKLGMTVQFKMTEAMREAVNATIGEQVALIQSIPEQHFSKIEAAVMRGVQHGRNWKQITDDVQEIGDTTRKRAKFIARDQMNKSTAVITRERQRSMGCTHAQWLHSAGGKTKRPSHVEASKNKLVYEIDKGAFLEDIGGKWDFVWPGTAIGCRCTSLAVIPLKG